MNTAAAHLDWSHVAYASTLVILSVLLSLGFHLKLEKSLIVAAVRCVLQLGMLGLVLEPVFLKSTPVLVATMSLALMILSTLEVNS